MTSQRTNISGLSALGACQGLRPWREWYTLYPKALVTGKEGIERLHCGAYLEINLTLHNKLTLQDKSSGESFLLRKVHQYGRDN
jgi:hypothetical protein